MAQAQKKTVAKSKKTTSSAKKKTAPKKKPVTTKKKQSQATEVYPSAPARKTERRAKKPTPTKEIEHDSFDTTNTKEIVDFVEVD